MEDLKIQRKLIHICENISNEKSKEVVLKYFKHKVAEGISENRQRRILDFLCHLLTNFDFDLTKMTEDQMKEVVAWVNSHKEWKEWTRYTYLHIFKNFCRWLCKKYKLSLPLDEIKIKEPKNSVMPEYLITEDEFKKLLDACEDPQFKTLLGVLYESGCRIGEILGLKIQNVDFNEYGAKLYVKGKTGQRIIPIIWFAGMLRQHIEAHPLKDNPEAPLWIIKDPNGNFKAMTYGAFRMRLRRLCQKVGIKKRIHAHLFRHTRLTELAKELPEQTLKQLAGWVADSKMAQVYVHLSQRDVEESLLTRVYGIKKAEDKPDEKVKICPKCKEPNHILLSIVADALIL